MVGTPEIEMSEVNATVEGKIVHKSNDPMTQMKMTALRGCPFLSTRPIHSLPGKIPSRAIAETRREAATTQMEMFYTVQGLTVK